MKRPVTPRIGFIFSIERKWVDRVRNTAATLGFRPDMAKGGETWKFHRGRLCVHFCIQTLELRTLEDGIVKLHTEDVESALVGYEGSSRNVKCAIIYERIKVYLEDTLRIQKTDGIDGAPPDRERLPHTSHNGTKKRPKEKLVAAESRVTITLTADQLKLVLAGVKLYTQALSHLPEVSTYSQLKELEKSLS